MSSVRWKIVCAIGTVLATTCLVYAARPTTHQLRLARLPQAPALMQLKARLAPNFGDRYAGLATADLLREQIAYQLYRNEIVRRKKVSTHRLETEHDGKRMLFQLEGSGGTYRRYAFRTVWFPKLRANALQALKDLRVVLTRLGDQSATERIELCRLVFMLGKSPASFADARAILLAEAIPMPTTALVPPANLKVRFSAMNFYNLLEKDPKVRLDNNKRFIASMGNSAVRALAVGRAVQRAKAKRRKKTPAPVGTFHPVYQDISKGRRPFIVPVQVDLAPVQVTR
jgi:hypothetical protein